MQNWPYVVPTNSSYSSDVPWVLSISSLNHSHPIGSSCMTSPLLLITYAIGSSPGKYMTNCIHGQWYHTYCHGVWKCCSLPLIGFGCVGSSNCKELYPRHSICSTWRVYYLWVPSLANYWLPMQQGVPQGNYIQGQWYHTYCHGLLKCCSLPLVLAVLLYNNRQFLTLIFTVMLHF